MPYTLKTLNPQIKRYLFAVLTVLTIGVSLGLYFISIKVGTDQKEIIEHYQGNQGSTDEFEIKYGKNLKELVLTVHNHVISFVFIFVIIGLMFWGVADISPNLKTFLLIEPFFSILLTFGSMFLIRYVAAEFVYLMIASSTVLYLSYYGMAFYCLRDLLKSSE